MVITGKDRGKSGKVKLVFRRDFRVVVEGVNIVKKHKKPAKQGEPGGIMEFEAPVHISNVMVMDPNKGKPSRVGFKFDKDGKKAKTRVSKKSGAKLS